MSVEDMFNQYTAQTSSVNESEIDYNDHLDGHTDGPGSDDHQDDHNDSIEIL